MTRLTIITVTFESAGIIRQCLSHINFDKYHSIIVDNASQDDTVAIVKKEFPRTQIIQSSKNNGYGRANNLALRQCESEYALILNPDAFLFEEDIEKILQLMDENPQIAMASPLIYPQYPISAEQIQKRLNGFSTEILQQGFLPQMFIAGGVLFMRMEVLRKIGFFSEEFFMFAEDNELCDRVIAAGYKNVIVTGAKSFHQSGRSSAPNLRNRYRRFWHLGWSKSLYRRRRKNFFNAKRSTARLTIVYFCQGLFALVKGDKLRATSKFAFSCGCLASLIGLKAFDKNDNPRGNLWFFKNHQIKL